MNNNFVRVIVYADDIVLISPCIDGLQRMINTCESYATQHNLSFSTNKDPKRSKTKCIAFQRKKTRTCFSGSEWKRATMVKSVKHLGSTITDNIRSIMNQDIAEKRGIYTAKNNELIQEFHFAHLKTKIWGNHVFNTSFYGAPLWDISTREFQRDLECFNPGYAVNPTSSTSILP